MQFRRTCETDIDRIMDILADGRAALGALGIDQWQGGYPNRAVVEADAERGDSFVIEDEGEVIATVMVGFGGEVVYDRIEGGSWLTESTSADPRYAAIHRVAVNTARKNKGAGLFLLASAEEYARDHGRESVRVDTHPGNVPMRRLLEKRGYERCGTIYIDHAEEGTPERIGYEKLL